MNYQKPYRQKRKPIYDASTGEPPTEQQTEAMKAQAKRVADYWLGVRDYSSQEIYKKIERKGIIPEIIIETIKEYTDKGYLDDHRFAENFVYSKMTYEKYGVSTIRYKLYQKGIDREIVDEVIENINTEELNDNAYQVAYKKALSNRNVPSQKRLQQIVGVLARKGYTNDVFKVAQQAIADVDNET